ncbi:hypothetical protein [Sabulicella glaciei]|uniref:Flagellar protein FlgN n=1 Tax=Sabulicella glaciei TaxID=2984948 RepID=A0ABT3NT08_9PROT|nr:hypothetical protein [Roseococcus sp. MDT2-1-1]MCW8085291.1 hypothetical protein [Roseococcus sp. MDT2-1-1]
MMNAVITAGERLVEALHAENEALAALDLTRAAALAQRKMQASDAFAAAAAAASRARARALPATREHAERMTRALEALGEENRRLLEDAIALQSRVIEAIAGAARPLSAAPGYGRAGMPRPARQAVALAVTTRA